MNAHSRRRLLYIYNIVLHLINCFRHRFNFYSAIIGLQLILLISDLENHLHHEYLWAWVIQMFPPNMQISRSPHAKWVAQPVHNMPLVPIVAAEE